MPLFRTDMLRAKLAEDEPRCEQLRDENESLKQFLREAHQMRKELSFPKKSQVFKLSIVALLATVFLMGIVSFIDFVLLKMLAEPYLRHVQKLALAK